MTTPAFPSTNALATASGVMTQGHPGMDLRDYFAAKAMQGFAASESDSFNWKSETAADRAYEWADAMLAARKGGAA